MDPRENLQPQGGSKKLFPYAKDLYYHPDGILSMTIEIFDEVNTYNFSFGFAPNGNLKEFLDQIKENHGQKD